VSYHTNFILIFQEHSGLAGVMELLVLAVEMLLDRALS
jgi:hypothetical protein